MNNITFVVNSPFRLNLYKKLASLYKRKDPSILICFIVFDSASYINLLFLKLSPLLHDITIITVRNKIAGSNVSIGELNLEKTSDFLTGYFDLTELEELSKNLSSILKSLSPKVELIYGGNGYHCTDIVIKSLRKELGFKTMFSELSNIDDRIFFDVDGSNAGSFYFKKFDYCNTTFKSNVSNKEFTKWVDEYKKRKLNSHVVKQSKKLSPLKEKIKSLAVLIDSVLFPYSLVWKNRLTIKGEAQNIGSVNGEDLANKKIAFLPLQLVGDTQLLLNSSYTNIDAILLFKNISDKNGLELYVKFHPSESNKELINEVQKMSKTLNFIITKDNTFSLIDKSECVYVNNSTVALEALLFDKNVNVIGKSFYSFLRGFDDINNYLNGYLIPGDFFSGNGLCLETLDKINELIDSCELGDEV